ncbi:MAG: response regulator, partial [Rhizobiales bacterium]|nr:response regulator [Rhizobacter sp.]
VIAPLPTDPGPAACQDSARSRARRSQCRSDCRMTRQDKPAFLAAVGGMGDLIVGIDWGDREIGPPNTWPTAIKAALATMLDSPQPMCLCWGDRLAFFFNAAYAPFLGERRGSAIGRPFAGQYISVCVTDTGTGMMPEVAARAFDPLFTTKPLGQGTGLGLSMVYGFVRQSEGQVRICSEVGHGTTMCMYFPRHLGDAAAAEAESHDGHTVAGDGQVVMLIDDEETIRAVVAEALVEAGYRVIDAEDGPSGLRMLRSERRVDLLVTDVGLPGGMNGRQVSDAARVVRPGLKVLFITGYAENAAVGGGRLDPGMQVLTKPFDIAELANRVDALLQP